MRLSLIHISKVRVASSSLVFRSFFERMLEWWNGRHEGLKILWPLRLDVYKRQDFTFQLVNSEFILPKACCIKFKRMYSRVRTIFDVVIIVKKMCIRDSVNTLLPTFTATRVNTCFIFANLLTI